MANRVGATLADLPPAEHTPEEAEQATAEVLARPEYADLRPTLLERIGEWVTEGINWFLMALGETGGGLLGLAILGLGVAVAVVVAVRVVGRVRRSATAPSAQVGVEGRSPEDWAEEAERHEAAGAWREAVRCRHRALVAELVAHRVAHEVPGRTAREYRAAAVAALPAVTEPLDVATAAFERAWYQHDRVNPGDVDTVRDAAARVRDQLPVAARSTG